MIGLLLKNSFRFCKKADNKQKIHSSNLEILYQMSKKSKTPFFTTQSHHIQIIEDPLQFYLQLQTQVKKTVRRIGISSLYLGTGTLERNLFKNIVKRINNVPGLELCMLLDYHRSSRPEKGESSIEMMNYYLAGNDRERIKIAFHEQSKASKHIIGELKGVHHQKFAIFDDTVIVGGANLSHNYFLNRKDRYLKFKECPDLCDYLNDYLQVFYQNSYQLGDSNDPQKSKNTNLDRHYKMWKFAHTPEEYKQTLFEQEQYLEKIQQEKEYQISRTIKDSSKNKKRQIPKSRNQLISEVLGSDIQAYNQMELKKFEQLREDVRQRLFETSDEDDVGNHVMHIEDIKTGKQITQIGEKVYIFPFVQNKKILNEDFQEKTTLQILKQSVSSNFPIRISSGYQNFTPQILNILGKSQIPTQVLCSSPEANSFYHAGKLKKYIPYFYRCFVGGILQKYGRQKFNIKQFNDGKWSFHAKGMWIKQNENNYLTIVGSSNFNHRSKARDTELQLFLYSTCPAFNYRLDQQWEDIEKNCKEISLQEIKNDKDTKFNWISKFFSKVFSGYL